MSSRLISHAPPTKSLKDARFDYDMRSGEKIQISSVPSKINGPENRQDAKSAKDYFSTRF